MEDAPGYKRKDANFLDRAPRKLDIFAFCTSAETTDATNDDTAPFDRDELFNCAQTTLAEGDEDACLNALEETAAF